MLSAGMAITMMIAVCACVNQLTFEICLHCFVSIPGRACTQFDSLLLKSRLRSSPDSTTDQNIYFILSKKPRQGSMSVPI